MVSPGKPGIGWADLSTLMPGIEPACSMSLTSGVPSLAVWRIVSSNRITPEMCSFIAFCERNMNSR